MTNQTISQLLILFLLIFSSARFLFIRNVQTDGLASLPLIGFLLSIGSLWAFGISTFQLILIGESFFVLLWNIRAFLRLNDKLLVDHFNPLFIVISIICLLFLIPSFIVVIIFRPMKADFKKMEVKQHHYTMAGTLQDGFHSTDGNIEIPKAQFWNYSYEPKTAKSAESVEISKSQSVNTNTENSDIIQSPTSDNIKQIQEIKSRRVILFIPSKTAAQEIYSQVLVNLAHDGYEVWSGFFYSKDNTYFGNFRDNLAFRTSLLRLKKVQNPEEYSSLIKSKADLQIAEWQNFYTCVQTLSTPFTQDDQIYLVSDEDLSESMKSYASQNASVTGWYDLAGMENYPSKGFGPIENTYPILAKYLGIKPDKSMALSNNMANTIKKQFEPQEETQIQNSRE